MTRPKKHWENLHEDSTVVDLHTHPSLKSLLFHRNLGGGKRRFLATLKEAAFWPFSERITFPKLEQGGVDVMLSTAYILEQGWIDDIKLIKWLFRLFPRVRKLVVEPSYFDATNTMLDEMESQVEAYNLSRPESSKAVSITQSVSELEDNLKAGVTSIIHSVEGAHSLQHHKDGAGDESLLDSVQHFFDRGVA